MRAVKLSLALAALLAMGASADVTNVKFSGDAKLFYSTNDMDPNDLFDKKASMGQAAADLGMSADLAGGVKLGASITGLGTLGLENNLVSAIWAGFDNSANGSDPLDTQWWLKEAYLVKTFGNTTVKVGRQKLDTPLAFSETWNIAENTFDAAVILNQDIQDTTLVGAWVGRGNGAKGFSVVQAAAGGKDPFRTYGSAIDDVLGTNRASGAYAAGVITKAISGLTFQAWYYDVVDLAQAFWVQGDLNVAAVPGLTFGAQYANISPDDDFNVDDSKGWALKLGYDFQNGLKASVAYSSTDDGGAVNISNTATGTSGAQSKLYTEAWWNFGYVGAPDTDAYNVTLEYSASNLGDFGLYYTSTSNDTTDVDMNEVALTASKSYGPLDVSLAYIYTDADDQNNGDSYNTVQAYLTYNF